MKYVALVSVAVLVLSVNSSIAQDDDELITGLNLELSTDAKTVSVSGAGVSFNWADKSPDQRLSAGAFRARWSGSLLLQQGGGHRFYAYVQGDFSVRLGEKVVLVGKAAKPQWVQGADFQPELGLQPLAIEFSRTDQHDQAQFHLFWSSETFPLEPLPSQFLFSDAVLRNANSSFESGRVSFEQSRCVNCHQREHTSTFASPDLSRSLAHLDEKWITAKVSGKLKGTMPDFGFDANEARDIAAFLKSQAKNISLSKLPKAGKGQNNDKDTTAGHTLLSSLGCVACHSVEKQNIQSASKIAATDLSSIGLKRPKEWFYLWLKSPEKLNSSHRMPVFTLSNTERRQLALALSALREEPAVAIARGSLDSEKQDTNARKLQRERGRKLVTAAGCAACHQIEGVAKSQPRNLADLAKPIADWGKSCLNEKPNRSVNRPAFPQVNAAHVREYVSKMGGTLSPSSDFEFGRQLMQAKGCNDCHPRNSARGLSSIAGKVAASNSTLRGQAPGMVPPSLTAVGDKLLDAALLKSIHGEQIIRKPWLHVRMPKFKHTKEEAAAIVAYLIGHDRIPSGAPNVKKLANTEVDDQTLLTGQALVGPKGFSCIACHKVGSYEPRNTALGTKGSDLLNMGKRMRPSFFLRWTRSPLRIVPGLEMPGYTKPAKGALGDDVDRQLGTLWHTLNDPRFQAPTNPASVEQYLVVDSGQARIVRDVFENPKKNGGGYVARSFAVGFGNQHNVLFDLDSMTLRAWTFGDFARQRTSGKSWYWDMAGSYVMTGFTKESDFALVPKRGDVKPLKPSRDNGTVGRLLDYQTFRDGVQLRYQLFFDIEKTRRPIEIVERFLPFQDAQQTGWLRLIVAAKMPAGYDLQVWSPAVPKSDTLGKPRIKHFKLIESATEGPAKNGEAQPAAGAQGTVISANEAGIATTSIEYSSELKSSALQVNLKSAPTIAAHKITSVPGFQGSQLPLPGSIMPTALTTLPDGTLAFTSLKGDVYLAKDGDGDGLEDTLTLFEEGLSAPYGILADGDSLLVAHKPEVIRLRDTDGDGRADQRSVFATGWGFNDNYHDWACSLIKNSKGEMFLGLGGDYSQKGRPIENSRWRGTVVKISQDGNVRPFSHGFRYPTGLAIDSQGRLFGTDNQGVQNCFNELNHLRDGVHYGVPALHEQDRKFDDVKPAIQVPHPWTRSVNGIAILPQDFADKSLRGHGIGCEYNGKLLVRWTYHEVGGQLQGATFFMSRPNYPKSDQNFLGPINTHVTKSGDIYVGSIHDSGWLGGLNTGSIVKLKPAARTLNGIRDIQATANGFRLDFFDPVNEKVASNVDQYSLSGYTRVWGGSYASPDSGRYIPKVTSAIVSKDRKSVELKIDRRQTGFVYEINCKMQNGTEPFWPATGHYTLHQIPK